MYELVKTWARTVREVNGDTHLEFRLDDLDRRQIPDVREAVVLLNPRRLLDHISGNLGGTEGVDLHACTWASS
jgi:hypothetical protein